MVQIEAPVRTDLDEKLFGAYEAGKHRRYNLLFAVNGGAFAIAKLLGEGQAMATGGLTLRHLAVGMVLFTTIMSFDVLAFGHGMRRRSMRHRSALTLRERFRSWTSEGLFRLPGWIVLGTLWLLISAGWLLVGFGES
jgi:hypothetical protein